MAQLTDSGKRLLNKQTDELKVTGSLFCHRKIHKWTFDLYKIKMSEEAAWSQAAVHEAVLPALRDHVSTQRQWNIAQQHGHNSDCHKYSACHILKC